MKPEELTDEQLLYIVGQTDTELFKAGMEIKRRYWEVPRAVMRKFGYVSYVMAGNGKPPILDQIESIFASIYRKHDLAIGGHIGVYMYRDIFARISVPHAYGHVAIKPFDHVDLTDIQKRIMGTEPDEVEMFLDQFSDVADVQYGSTEIKSPYARIELVDRYVGLSRLHLHAAAAVVTGGYDYRGAIQSALLATELALKSGAASQGLAENEIKNRFNHDFPALITFLAAVWPNFDSSRIGRVVAQQPKYVPNRYSKSQPERREVGHIVMGAQYIVAEVIRQLSDRNFRVAITPSFARRYPA